jgi:hypothetical protein
MAFEGLFIEIMKLKVVPKFDLLECRKIGIFLKLNEDSVFDYDFWIKFDNFCKTAI